MSAHRSLIIASGLTLLWSADARAQRPIIRNGLRADLLGCYALYSDPPRVGRSLYNASPFVRLDSSRVGTFGSDTIPGVIRALVRVYATEEQVTPARRSSRDPTWMADSLTDTVRLSFVNGFSGAVFVLAAPGNRPDTLTGRRFERWDFGPPFETTHGPARAIRRPCNRLQ
jgi:hypothetical protein